MLSIGETVRVKVLDIDRDRQRISLGLKQTQEDPWQTVLNEYKPNDILEGKVTKVVAFGAFVEIVPGVEGLVHISELAEHHVETPGEVVQPGQETWVRILEIDEERRRISLSVKRAQAQRQPSASRPDPAGAAARQPAAAARRAASPRRRRRTSASPRRSSPSRPRRAEAAEPVAEAPEPVAEVAEEEPAADPPAEVEAADPEPPAEQVVEEAAEEAGRRRHRRPPSPKKPPEASAVAAAPATSATVVLGLTGAIAAGKSEALAALRAPGRRDPVRPTPSSTTCSAPSGSATCWSGAGAPRSRPGGEVDRGARRRDRLRPA